MALDDGRRSGHLIVNGGRAPRPPGVYLVVEPVESGLDRRRIDYELGDEVGPDDVTAFVLDHVREGAPVWQVLLAGPLPDAPVAMTRAQEDRDRHRYTPQVKAVWFS